MYFDLRDDDAVVVEVWGLNLRGSIITAPTVTGIIEEITSLTGRMKPLPKWTQVGAVAGLEGGTKEVKEHVDVLLRSDVKLSGVWLQDWVGLRHAYDGDRLVWNWALDRSYYPEWDEMQVEFEQHEIRMLTYINPFFSNPAGLQSNATRNIFHEGVQNKFYIQSPSGGPYVLRSGSIEFHMIDLTNPRARVWMKDIIKREMIVGAKSSGWMEDFGEYLPFDAVMYSGISGAEYHNQYPTDWAAVNEEAIAEYRLENSEGVNNAAIHADDIVYFMRSAALDSPGHTSLYWLGDQLVTWDQYDGIKSAVVGALSGGIGGHSLTHSDIGGYTMVRMNDAIIRNISEIICLCVCTCLSG